MVDNDRAPAGFGCLVMVAVCLAFWVLIAYAAVYLWS